MASEVFISYAAADNVAEGNSRGGWVSRFKANLVERLGQITGRFVSVYLDVEQLRPGDRLSTIFRELRESRVLVCIVSPALVGNFRAFDELHEFLSREPMSRPVFLVEKYPTRGQGILLPEALHGQPGYLFWTVTNHNDPMEAEESTDLYRHAMNVLVHDIARALGESIPVRRSVYLGIPSKELQSVRAELEEELRGQGYDVEPRTPFEGPSFEYAVQKALQNSVLSVHLIGASDVGIAASADHVFDTRDAIQWRAARSIIDECPAVVWLPSVARSYRQEEVARAIEHDDADPVIVRGPLHDLKRTVRSMLRTGARTALRTLTENDAERVEVALRLTAKESFEKNRTRGLRVQALSVESLPFFGKMTWDLRPGVNVLLGRNGYGKSHLLRMVASLLARDGESIRDFFGERGDPQARLELALEEGATDSSSTPPVIVRNATSWVDRIGKVPVLAISDTRTLDRSARFLKKQELDSDERLPEGGAFHFVRQQSNGSIIEQALYLLCLDYVAQGGVDGSLIQLFHDTVAKLSDSGLRIVDVKRASTADGSFEIFVTTDGNETPVSLRHASQGTLSVVAIFLQIYYFLAALDESTDVPASEVMLRSAIVIVDEIDAHLHPAWQRQILRALHEAFPNVQLIVSAHSPLVVAGCRRGEVATMRRRESPDRGFYVEAIDEDFLGWGPAEILSRALDVDADDVLYVSLREKASRKDEFELEAEELASKTDRTPQDEERLRELTTLLADIDAAELQASRKIDVDELQLKVADLEGELRRARSAMEGSAG
jgi:hypothetical protein